MEKIKNVLVFGTGKAYVNRKHYFDWNDGLTIMGFIDNDSVIQGTEIDGVKVYAPKEIQGLQYDAIVLLSNQYFEEQRQQLITLGISNSKIWDYYRLKSEFAAFEGFDNKLELSKEDLLIITFQFGVDGGSLATLYLAEALKKDWKNIYIATDTITDNARKEADKYKIKIMIHKSLPYMSDGFVKCIKHCGYVIVNTLPMLPAAIALNNKGVTSCMWIHEGEEVWYKAISKVVGKNNIPEEISYLFVSDVSKELFSKYYEINNYQIVPIAIPDRLKSVERISRTQLRIAVIGPDAPNKNLMLIIKAVKNLPLEYCRNIKIDFYGVDDEGKKRIETSTEGKIEVVVQDMVEPQELHRNLDFTDCVVCTSLKECLPTTAVEGFMHKCIVVVPDSAGVAKYINDGENGFIYKTNDEMSLAKCLKIIMDNVEYSWQIRDKSRLIYEKFFTYESLRESFMNLMLKKK